MYICYTGFEGGGKVCSFIESESGVKVTQLCQTLYDPMYCSPWNSPVQNARVGSLFLLQGIFLTQRSNSGLLHCRQILYQMSHKGLNFIEKESHSQEGEKRPNICLTNVCWAM